VHQIGYTRLGSLRFLVTGLLVVWSSLFVATTKNKKFYNSGLHYCFLMWILNTHRDG